MTGLWHCGANACATRNQRIIAARLMQIDARRYGAVVNRSFTLGQEMDQNAAKAKYSDGVLELTLPKKQGSAGKEIKVS